MRTPHSNGEGLVGSSRDGRLAAIVDVENFLIGRDGLLPVATGAALLAGIKHGLAGIPVRAATGPSVMAAYMSALAGLGWGLTGVGRNKDAADEALIRAGWEFQECGVTDLLVFSGDHGFAVLATIADLHVVSMEGKLSRELQMAATTVTLLPDMPTETREAA